MPLCACASARTRPISAVSNASAAPPAERTHDIHDGVFHEIRPGETLYRVARAYGVSVEDLRAENGISDPAQLATGSLLFVPRAERTVEIDAARSARANVEPRPPRRAPPPQFPRAGAGTRAEAPRAGPLRWLLPAARS